MWSHANITQSLSSTSLLLIKSLKSPPLEKKRASPLRDRLGLVFNMEILYTLLSPPLIHPPQLLPQLQQAPERLNSFFLQAPLVHQFPILMNPVMDKLFFQVMFGWVSMVYTTLVISRPLAFPKSPHWLTWSVSFKAQVSRSIQTKHVTPTPSPS